MTNLDSPVVTAPDTRVLFLDMREVDERHNLVQAVCQARKHPLNPILPLGDLTEWDSASARTWEAKTVIYDEDEEIFKLWYTGCDVGPEMSFDTGYAESRDGVHWEKPRLGIFEYNGQKDNNICARGWGPLIRDTAEEDPSRRYKMVNTRWGEGIPRVCYSPDGIHWSEGPYVEVQGLGRTPGDVCTLLRDEQDPDPSRRYKMVWELMTRAVKPGPEKVRSKAIAYSADGEHWVAGPEEPIITPNDGLEQEIHFLLLEPYFGHYVMLYEYGWYSPDGTGNFGRYGADIRLAVSRDCEHFQRINPHQQVIPRGSHGAWDSGFLVISDKALIKDDTIYIYYSGQGFEQWKGWPGKNLPPDFPFEKGALQAFRTAQTGLATLRLDGFTCLETADGETPGHMTTAPIAVQEPAKVQLILNMSDGIPLTLLRD